MDQKTKDSILLYLEKSYRIIKRQTETIQILMNKNKDLLAKNIFYQTKIKMLKEENRELKKKLDNKSNTETDFEFL